MSVLITDILYSISNVLSAIVIFCFFSSWHSLPPHKDLAITSLSSSLCDMIIYLREVLDKLKQELVDCLFTCFWKQLAEDLSGFLFDEVFSYVRCERE